MDTTVVCFEQKVCISNDRNAATFCKKFEDNTYSFNSTFSLYINHGKFGLLLALSKVRQKLPRF